MLNNDGWFGKNWKWLLAFAALVGLAAFSWAKSLVFDAQVFFDREMKPYEYRIECVEEDVNNHDEEINEVEKSLTRIEEQLREINRKLDKMNGG